MRATDTTPREVRQCPWRAARLSRMLDPYVAANRLGYVYRPRAVLRFEGSEVEPDLMVRRPQPDRNATWDTAPTPLLIVEILSPYTRRRDRDQKKSLYMDADAGEYWILDAEWRTITVVRQGRDEGVESETVVRLPPGAPSPLEISVAAAFGPAADEPDY